MSLSANNNEITLHCYANNVAYVNVSYTFMYTCNHRDRIHRNVLCTPVLKVV